MSPNDEVLVWIDRAGNYVVWPRGFFRHSGRPTRIPLGNLVEYIVAVKGSCDRPGAAKRAAWIALLHQGWDPPRPKD